MNTPCRVLVYGARKSGTTLTQRLLDSKFIFCHPNETKIKLWTPAVKMDSQAQLRLFYQASCFEFYGINGNNYWKNVARNCRKPRTLKEYIMAHVELFRHSSSELPEEIKLSKSFIIKEVGGSANYVINSFKKAFPEGYVIIVLRSPLCIASSVYRYFRKEKKTLTLKRKIYEARDPWRITKELLELDRSGISVSMFDYNSICFNPSRFLEEFKAITDFSQPIPPEPTHNGIAHQTRTASRKTQSGVFLPNRNAYQDLSLDEKIIIFIFAALNFLVYLRYKHWSILKHFDSVSLNKPSRN